MEISINIKLEDKDIDLVLKSIFELIKKVDKNPNIEVESVPIKSNPKSQPNPYEPHIWRQKDDEWKEETICGNVVESPPDICGNVVEDIKRCGCVYGQTDSSADNYQESYYNETNYMAQCTTLQEAVRKMEEKLKEEND